MSENIDKPELTFFSVENTGKGRHYQYFLSFENCKIEIAIFKWLTCKLGEQIVKYKLAVYVWNISLQ